jgi:transcriptional regulator with XRE-family HTH domain
MALSVPLYRDQMQIEKITMSEICSKLRSLRRARGWSLMDVEIASGGRLKAVVLGSYERGARSLSVRRALEIAELYGVPASQLFSDKKSAASEDLRRKMLDLRTLNARAQTDSATQAHLLLLARFTRSILELRQDWNGQVLSIRAEDCKALALMLNIDNQELLKWLDEEKILLAIR